MSEATTPPTGEPNAPAPQSSPATAQGRRGFFKRALATLIGGLITLFPVLAGLASFADPLRPGKRKLPGDDEPLPADVPPGYVRVTSLDALPADGSPQFFRVIADRIDAWTYFPKQPIGAIFLRKLQDGSVTAFNTTCPHAGCAVDFRSGKNDFYCPCHNSHFTIEGQRSAESPAARDLDTLDVLVRDENVWVLYKNFRTGTAERKEIS